MKSQNKPKVAKKMCRNGFWYKNANHVDTISNTIVDTKSCRER